MIPSRYLSKIDGHSVQIQGAVLTVKVVDLYTSLTFSESALGAYINSMKSAFKRGPRVVGVDIFTRLISDPCSNIIKCKSLVLCVGSTNCLIVHLPFRKYRKVPEVLISFLEDSDICFVGVTMWPSSLVREGTSCKHFSNGSFATRGIEAGHLASRVRRDPALHLLSLEDISRKIGIHYQVVGPAGKEIVFDGHNPTDEQLKAAVNDAYAYYRIGHKLLAPL